ncbi:Sulfate permease, MFS superfamily [Catalinimonas alkaloidigena]|uniref:Sulfate permease, MFS superfamily n=1 Tax=Catalinimonas alkaloidigena TaxID=1075417 RepID=A0A1G9BPK2_9BACT|nr:SulP family inorganic anion transporter [Catalinimonas alkaloidigena]SDK41418.1 Sulfate permease, MFS superfamily [Catalinimonas alkaloidigena]
MSVHTETILVAPPAGWAGFQQTWRADLVSGLLVFLIVLPLSLGIAIASGFPPMAGLMTAVIGGVLITFFSDAQLTIKGPAVGLIAIMAGAVDTLGQGHLLTGYRYALAVIVVAGLVQVAFSLVKAGQFGDFFPASAVHGMLAAIGIRIMAKQIPVLLGASPGSQSPFDLVLNLPRFLADMNPEVAIIGVVSLAILIGVPLLNNRYARLMPAPMLVILVAVPLGFYFDLAHAHKYLFLDHHEYTLGPEFLITLPDRITEGLVFPDFGKLGDFATWKYVFMLALVGSLESLLTVKAIDALDPYQRKSRLSKDLFAIGLGNALCGLVGALPMISEVVRSSANLHSGARTRWANFFHGAFLLLFVAFLPRLIHQIPLAALAALLIYTGYRLASPRAFAKAYQVGPEQLAIYCTTVIVTLATDLLVGIGAGILVKILIHLTSGASLRSLFWSSVLVDVSQPDTVHIKVQRAAVFSNYLWFKKRLDAIPSGKRVLLDFSQTRVVDHTFMEHLHRFEADYTFKGGRVEVVGMDDHQPVSDHPTATRRKKTNTADPLTTP